MPAPQPTPSPSGPVQLNPANFLDASSENNNCGPNCLVHACCYGLATWPDDFYDTFNGHYHLTSAAKFQSQQEFLQFITDHLANPLDREILLGPVMRKYICKAYYDDMTDPVKGLNYQATIRQELAADATTHGHPDNQILTNDDVFQVTFNQQMGVLGDLAQAKEINPDILRYAIANRLKATGRCYQMTRDAYKQAQSIHSFVTCREVTGTMPGPEGSNNVDLVLIGEPDGHYNLNFNSNPPSRHNDIIHNHTGSTLQPLVSQAKIVGTRGVADANLRIPVIESKLTAWITDIRQASLQATPVLPTPVPAPTPLTPTPTTTAPSATPDGVPTATTTTHSPTQPPRSSSQAATTPQSSTQTWHRPQGVERVIPIHDLNSQNLEQFLSSLKRLTSSTDEQDQALAQKIKVTLKGSDQTPKNLSQDVSQDTIHSVQYLAPAASGNATPATCIERFFEPTTIKAGSGRTIDCPKGAAVWHVPLKLDEKSLKECVAGLKVCGIKKVDIATTWRDITASGPSFNFAIEPSLQSLVPTETTTTRLSQEQIFFCVFAGMCRAQGIETEPSGVPNGKDFAKLGLTGAAQNAYEQQVEKWRAAEDSTTETASPSPTLAQPLAGGG